MKKVSFIYLMILAGGIIDLGFLAMPAFAQDVPTLQKLQSIINAQQQLIEAQQKQLDAQMQSIQKLQKEVQSLAKGADKKGDTGIATKPLAESSVPSTAVASKPAAEPPKKHARLYRDYDWDPAGSPKAIIDPTETIQIPETATKIGIHGFATLQIFHDTNDIDNVEWVTGKIPVEGSDSATHYSVSMSRIEVSSETPSQWGQLNTFIGMDFFGNGQPNSPDFRLRQAYGELGFKDLGLSVLAGQDFATMIDLKAFPETLEYLGPAAAFNRRQPLLRVTKAIADDMTAQVAFETPENVSYINADKRTRWPDLVLTGTWQPGGKYLEHIKLAGLLRDLRAEGPDGSEDSALGMAIQGTGKVMLPLFDGRDNFKFLVNYGTGYGAQVSSGFDDAVFDTGSGELKTIDLFGVAGGFQHWWSGAFRSNLVFGYLTADNPGVADGDVIDSTSYGAANIIWTPFSNTMFGLEYLWGRRENEDGRDGTSSRFLFSNRFSF
jgi:hypothetical protein